MSENQDFKGIQKIDLSWILVGRIDLPHGLVGHQAHLVDLVGQLAGGHLVPRRRLLAPGNMVGTWGGGGGDPV